MSRRWIAMLLALAACASGLAEDSEEQNAPTAIFTSGEPFTINFSEDVEGFSLDNFHLVAADDDVFTVVFTPHEHVSSFQIAPPLRVGVEDGRNRTQTLDIFEDMKVFQAVLSDLVEKAFPDDHFFPRKLRIHPVYLGSGCLYIVDFPYPLADSRPSRADAETDAVWEAARQRMGVVSLDSGETYDAEKAAQFQNAVLSAFKHASNMRHFADADHIAVSAVSGGAAPTYFSARAEFGSLANPSTSSGRMDVSTAQGGAVVMARVLDKTLQEKLGGRYRLEKPGRLYTGNPSAVSSGARLDMGAGGVYLEGYGALFVADVQFPLTQRSEDDLWEQSARELRSGRSDPLETEFTVTVPFVSDSSGSPIRTTGSSYGYGLTYGTSPYGSSCGDEEQLKGRLTEAVLDALKYASRIQGMEAEELVAVLIRGAEETQMSFRALKRDVDAYGKGEWTRAQFQEKLQMR